MKSRKSHSLAFASLHAFHLVFKTSITLIHSDNVLDENKNEKYKTKDLNQKYASNQCNIFNLLVSVGTLEFPNAQSYLSFASTDPPLSAINPTNSGITTPLSTLVAVAGKTSNKKRSPTPKNFPYLHFHEPKQETNNGIHQTGSYSHINEPKTPQRQIYTPFIQQPGGTFDPKSIDFSALQLPNTPPKTSRNKKNLHKTTSSSSPLSFASPSIVHTQIHH